MIIISHTSNIDMGGRMYDPVLSRFLNPDIVVQFPENSQSYNRYSYALNNPLKYTDPSGWFIDEWELDRKTGKISWLNDNKHYIERDGQQVEVDKLINSIGNYIDLSKGILGRNMGDDFQSYAFSNAVEAEDFYYFVAGSSNVEWAFMESKYGTGEVGADYGEGSTKMPGLYENTHSNTIKRMSHSHPPGGDGHPSYNVGGKDIGDLNNAKKSLYDYKREVYDVVWREQR